MNPDNYLLVSAELKNLPKIRRFIQESAGSQKIDSDTTYDIVLAVEEITSNIIVHGYNGARGNIEIETKKEDGSIIVQVTDQAKPIDPTRLPPPDTNLPLEERPVGGMGVFLTKNLMDEVTYQQSTSGENQLTLKKEVKQRTIEE